MVISNRKCDDVLEDLKSMFVPIKGGKIASDQSTTPATTTNSIGELELSATNSNSNSAITLSDYDYLLKIPVIGLTYERVEALKLELG